MNNYTTKQKKLLICADSFCADDNLNSWSWWNRLANELNAETINLSISGASNLNIFLQLEHGLSLDPDYILISLTSPLRIEEVKSPLLEEDLDFTFDDIQKNRVNSWIIRERVERGEISLDVANKFFDYKIDKRKNDCIAESIVNMCPDKNVCILANLFHDCNIKNKINYNIVPRDYSDVVTGQIDEPEAGHIHKTYHEKFYNDHKEELLSYYETK